MKLIALASTAALGLALAACAAEPEERTYEVDATDEGGGELIATPADAEGVEVNLPETEMTPVAPPIMEEGEAEAE